MAEPARKIYDEEGEGFYKDKPNLKAIPGGGEGDGKPQGKLKAVGSDDSMYKPNAQTEAEQAGLQKIHQLQIVCTVENPHRSLKKAN
jgi:hypothetical protein